MLNSEFQQRANSIAYGVSHCEYYSIAFHRYVICYMLFALYYQPHPRKIDIQGEETNVRKPGTKYLI
jgi:hypothetical protein